MKLVEKDEQLFAMKIFKTERVRDYEKFVQRMQKEMEIVRNLNMESIP